MNRGATMRARLWPPTALLVDVSLLGQPLVAQKADKFKTVTPAVKCSDRRSRDQDDMCIWVNPDDPAESVIIAADKYADMIFVYDLAGNTIQAFPARRPGNIDLRYGFRLGNDNVDIVAFNQRDDFKIIVCKMNRATRQLERVDDGNIRTAENYGGTLYQSAKTHKLYFVTTSYKGHLEQYELTDAGGKVSGAKVRGWNIDGVCEAATADDELGRLYIGDESRGVWELGAEPDEPAPGNLVIKRGENGLVADVEGLAIYRRPNGAGYLLVSNQGANNFKVYERGGKHAFLGTFAVRGAHDSDGLDVCNAALGPNFPKGLFACHTGVDNCPVLLTRWELIAEAMPTPLVVDTSWKQKR